MYNTLLYILNHISNTQHHKLLQPITKQKTNKQTNKQKCLQAFFRKPEGNMPPGKRRLIWGVNFTTQLTERGKKAVE